VPTDLADDQVGLFQAVNTSTWDAVSGQNELLAGRDDGIFTFIEDPLTPGRAIAADVGIQFDAVTFGVIGGQERLFAVGHRGDIDFNPLPDGPTIFQNILYQFDPVTGVATSEPQSDRVGDDRIQGAGTTTVERGFLDTNLNNGPGGRITGISILDNVMYAVSDTGGLFTVQNPLTNAATLNYVADLLPYSVAQPFNGIIDDIDYSVADVRAANALQQEVPPLDLDLSVWTQRFDADIGDGFNNTSTDLKHITVNGSGNHGFIDHFVENNNAGLNRPHGVTVGPGPDFDVFVASHDRDPASGAPRGEILRFDLATGTPKAPFVVDGAGGLEDPHSVVFGPDGNVYVSSTPTNEVLRYHYPSGAFMGAFISDVPNPTGLAFDATGDLYVGSGGGVRRFNGTTGQFIDIFTTSGTVNLNQAEGLAFDSIGNLYVADFGADAVLRYGPTGTFIDAVVPSGNGGLEEPTFLAFDSEELLYVSSFATNEVLRYNAADGVFIDAYVTAEDGGVVGPRGIAFDPNGNLLVASDHEDRQDVEGDTDWCQDHLGDCGVDKVLLFDDDTNLPAWRWQQDLALGAFITQGDLAGTAVAIDADTIVYGVPGESGDEGVVFVYIRDDKGTADPRDDAWIQQARLKASDGLTDDEFGASLDVDGDTLTVGAPGVTGFAPSTITDLTSPVVFEGDAASPSLLDIDDYSTVCGSG